MHPTRQRVADNQRFMLCQCAVSLGLCLIAFGDHLAQFIPAKVGHRTMTVTTTTTTTIAMTPFRNFSLNIDV